MTCDPGAVKPWLCLFLIVAACGAGGGGSTADPDAPGPDGPEPDARIPPACEAVGGGCRECLVGAGRAVDTSACTAAVCAIDDSCCEEAWLDRCTALADAVCEAADCVDAITISGENAIGVAFPDGDGFIGDAWPFPQADAMIHSMDWADGLDDDGDLDLIFGGDCHVFVFRNVGWSGGRVELEPVFQREIIPGCSVDPPDPALWWHGHRARWADADRDGDLDAFFVGSMGVELVEIASGAPVFAGEIIDGSAGELLDLLIVDVDGDGDVDGAAGFNDAPARLYTQGDAGAWTEGATLGDTQVYSISLCKLRGDAAPAIVTGGYDGTAAYQLDGDPFFPTGADVPGLGPVFEVACGDLDGDHDDELVAAVADSTPYLAIADYPTGAIWSSAVDLDPPLTENVFGLDVGDLDGDGAPDVVAQLATGGSVSPFAVLRNESDATGLAFVLEDGLDMIPDSQAERVQLVRLFRP